MWEVYFNGVLYDTYEEKWCAEIVLEMLGVTHPKANLEVKLRD